MGLVGEMNLQEKQRSKHLSDRKNKNKNNIWIVEETLFFPSVGGWGHQKKYKIQCVTTSANSSANQTGNIYLRDR